MCVCVNVCFLFTWRSLRVTASNVLGMWAAPVPVTFVVDKDTPELTLAVAGAAALPPPALLPLFSNFTLTVSAFDSATPDGLSVVLRTIATGGQRSTVNVSLGVAVLGTRTGNVSLYLPDGEHRLEAQAKDGAGNTSPLTALAVSVDSVPPVVTAYVPQWPPYVKIRSPRGCVAVLDVWTAAATVAAVVTPAGVPAGPQLGSPFAREPSLDPAVFCGELNLDEVSNAGSNYSVTLSARDPAGNTGVTTLWTVLDVAPPEFSAVLVRGRRDVRACGQAQGLTYCPSADALVAAGDCSSGGTVSPAAPCRVQWVVVDRGALLTSCRAGTDDAVDVVSTQWNTLEPGAFEVELGPAVATVLQPYAVATKVAVVFRAVDAAGAWRAGLSPHPPPPHTAVAVGEPHPCLLVALCWLVLGVPM
jgi:hypothetical protein